MRRRNLAPLFVAVLALLILVAITLLITHGGEVANSLKSGQSAISLILNLLQLLGVILILLLVVFVLIQYAQYARSRRFVFDGFSNASKLIDIWKMPLELTMLAREKLVYQFKVLYSEWEAYVSDVSPDSEALLADELYAGRTLPGQDLDKYVSPEVTRDGGTVEDLKKVISSLKDSEDINLIDLAGEIAPKEVSPFMKLIEAVVPPRIIRATGHLQWRREMAGRAGITFEFVDLASRRNLLVRTIWWRDSNSSKKAGAADRQPLSAMSGKQGLSANEEPAGQAQAAQPGDGDISQAAQRYIELLDPAMRWLALMFWEQRMESHIPLSNYTHNIPGKEHQAQVLYLLGSLYTASASRFPAYKDFFCQLAVEYFRQAMNTNKKWYLPCLYLGNLYRLKMQDKIQETRDEEHIKLLRAEALKLFVEAFKRAKSANEGRFNEQRIILAQALTELIADPWNDKYIQEVHENIKSIKAYIDSDGFDCNQPNCAALLYNLALWYGFANNSGVGNLGVSIRNEARRYLVYSLALSENLRDRVEQEKTFQFLIESNDLKYFKEELANQKQLTVKAEGTKVKWLDFKAPIDKILERR